MVFIILTWLFPNPWQWDIPMRLGGPWPNVSIQFWEATLRNYQEKGYTINYLWQITIAGITHTLINAYKSRGILPQSVPAKWRQCYAANLKENTHSASNSHKQHINHAAALQATKAKQDMQHDNETIYWVHLLIVLQSSYSVQFHTQIAFAKLLLKLRKE